MKFANNRIAILIFFYFRKSCEHFGHPTLLLPDPLLVKYDNVIWKYDCRNENSASRIFYSDARNKNYDTRIV